LARACRDGAQTAGGSIGGQIWLDPTIGLQHVGKHVYEGDPMTLFAPALAAA
jgi:hypothetical protein